MRLLANDVATLTLLGLWAGASIIAAVSGFAFAPLWRRDPWTIGAAAFLGTSLLMSPLIMRKVRWLSRMSAGGELVEATRDGWGEFMPALMELTGESKVRLPRYSYTFLGTAHHILFGNLSRKPPDRLRVLVDPERPDRAVILGAFAGDPAPKIRIPPISSHIGPWLDRRMGKNGCGCSFVIFMLAYAVTGFGFGHSSVPPGPLLNALVFVGLLAPVVALLHLLLRFVTRRR